MSLTKRLPFDQFQHQRLYAINLFDTVNRRGVWMVQASSPEGARVGFDSHRGENGAGGLYETRADGAGAERELLAPETGVGVSILDWSPEYILFSKGPPRGQGPVELWAKPLFGDRKAFLYLARATNAALSPNGRWLAYVIDEGGTNQVIVQSFPDLSKSRQRISPERRVAPSLET